MDASTVSPLPRSLGGWFPFLWSRVLFPGPTLSPEPIRFRSLLLLLLLPALLLYPCTSFRLFEPDESRYAQIPREMAERGDLILPTLQGEPYLDKPPLFYWLVLGSYQLFGVHDWSARLVPALAVHLTLLATYLFGRRLLGERAALWGTVLLCLAPGFLGMGRLLILDGLLTFWITLALFAGFEALRGPHLRLGWWLLAGLACGLGVLTKGPVALLLVWIPLWLHSRLSGQGSRLDARALAISAVIVLAIALPWFVILCWRIPSFASYFFWEHNLQRFLSSYAHARGIWFYGPILLLLLFPGSLLLWPCLRFLAAADEVTARQRPTELGFLLLAGLWCVFFFTLSTGKLPTYILPALPPLALALGYCLTRTSWGASRLPLYGAGLSLVSLLFLHYLAVPWYASYRSPMNRPDEVARLCTDPNTTVVCYPRHCNSVAFYLGRSDLRAYRSKEIEDLRWLVRNRQRTVILCTHRHSLDGLRELLPPDVRVLEEVHLGLQDIPGVPPKLMKPLAQALGKTALGLCDMVVLEPGQPGDQPIPPPSPRLLRQAHEPDKEGPLLSVPGLPAPKR